MSDLSRAGTTAHHAGPHCWPHLQSGALTKLRHSPLLLTAGQRHFFPLTLTASSGKSINASSSAELTFPGRPQHRSPPWWTHSPSLRLIVFYYWNVCARSQVVPYRPSLLSSYRQLPNSDQLVIDMPRRSCPRRTTSPAGSIRRDGPPAEIRGPIVVCLQTLRVYESTLDVIQRRLAEADRSRSTKETEAADRIGIIARVTGAVLRRKDQGSRRGHVD